MIATIKNVNAQFNIRYLLTIKIPGIDNFAPACTCELSNRKATPFKANIAIDKPTIPLRLRSKVAIRGTVASPPGNVIYPA